MKNIAIIGGGIIGLFTAYYLRKAGHKVTIFDDCDLSTNCSNGNAGMIVPSHIFPLASPGMISKGIKWMFNSTSPFYVKPRFNAGLIKWGWKFYSNSNRDHVERSIPVLKEISLLSKSLYQRMAGENPFDFGYCERGLLMLYQTKEVESEEAEAAHIATRNGIEAHVLSLREIQKIEPDIEVKARGGVFYPGDAHLTPNLLMKNLSSYLIQHGVTFKNIRVDDFLTEGNKIISIEADGDLKVFDEFVLASGAWSGMLSARLGIDLPMQGGKGYSFNLTNLDKSVHIPTLLLEGRVAVTPMGTSLRFGGTMEINGTDRSINMNRVRGIVETIPKYYPGLNVAMPAKETVWSGLRPCSPDGLPYIGRSEKYKNLIFATGHAMMGLSLGPATGVLVSELVSEARPSMNLSAFHPERYS